jgi:hypothetical protein
VELLVYRSFIGPGLCPVLATVGEEKEHWHLWKEKEGTKISLLADGRVDMTKLLDGLEM